MHKRFLSVILLLFSCLFLQTVSAATPFTIVIDPGHGGKDAGTIGSQVKEKDVVLAVGLKIGRLIKQRMPDVRVIYTRSTDVFIPLDQRAILANNAKANLFVSIHADHAESPTVKGAATFTLGQNRTRENLEIAKRENSVILLEDNYKQRYEGFDPNVPESYIMFEFLQDNYMNQSIQFASTLQKKFVASGRRDRGVRQDVFLVLRCTSMPSVLVELGFMSNQEEESYLISEAGQNEMAESLFKGFTDFKNSYERKSVASISTNKKANITSEKSDTPKTQNEDTTLKVNPDQISATMADKLSNLVFKVQLLTSPVILSSSSKKMKGIQMDYYLENKLYKYTYGQFSTFEEANRKRREFKTQFPDAFVVAFKNGEKIPIEQARAQSKH